MKTYKFTILKILSVIIALCFLTWAILISFNFVNRRCYPLKFREEVFSACEDFSIDKALVFAVIKVESDFNKDAVSSKGAVGLMQIKPSTAEYIAQKTFTTSYDLYSPKTNIRFGVWYLRYLILRFEDISVALCAYNAGEGNVSLWLKNREYSLDGRTLNKIPYPETDAYLKKIEKSRKKYVKLYVHILDK